MGASVQRRRIAVVTGTRAEFGLLRPVMRAIRAWRDLELFTVVTGTHLLKPARTVEEIAADFAIDSTIEMQREGETGRFDDARAVARGVAGFADLFDRAEPDVVVVLGDRIEAFAAATATAVAGIRLAQMHGGDRAEGIADESLRHAISKLAHIHLPATPHSAERLIAMGEEPRSVHLVGSPAIDGLDEIQPLTIYDFAALGSPEIVVLLHPLGRSDKEEYEVARNVLRACIDAGPTFALHPNHDAGRGGVVRAIEECGCPNAVHVPRERFIGLLRRAKVIVGNSSAGLIESGALRVPCLNVGDRQGGREKPPHVMDVPDNDPRLLDHGLNVALRGVRCPGKHPYGDGKAGEKTALVLATFDPELHPLRKRNSF